MRILLRMPPLTASLRTGGGFPAVKSEGTEVGQTAIPWTNSGPGAGALLLPKPTPSSFRSTAPKQPFSHAPLERAPTNQLAPVQLNCLKHFCSQSTSPRRQGLLLLRRHTTQSP